MSRLNPINPRLPVLWHGADYNPDQWQNYPEVLKEDLRLMREARCNVMAIGIFAWAALEPEEGRFEFGWLDRTMDGLASAGVSAILATPSGARPAWLAQKYPEVLRVDEQRRRALFGRRHNHCYTSPAYREKCLIINSKLAERYKDHPALVLWHLSNEYGGTCHCPLCEEAFRDWLRARYGTLDALNQQYWSAFWSHTYTDWSHIESPSSIGENAVHALNLDWRRFTTHQTVDFMKSEIAPLRRITPDVPVTTNLMGTYDGLDYWKLAAELDVVSWDAYPDWSRPGGDAAQASGIAFAHDLNRTLKGRPFLLMESTPSQVNWKDVCKLKKPGMHVLSSLQAVAHGSDSVQYFQWRKSRGSSEKFHGAVVDHAGHENTRVFREVTELGKALQVLEPVIGTTTPAEVALIFDWESRWALQDAQGPRREKAYVETCHEHHRGFWKLGIATDIIQSESDFTPYRVVVAPMLYMLKPGVAERLEQFVAGGGTLVATYLTGQVNETDLCYLGGFPGGPLRKVLGIWAEECDALYAGETNSVLSAPGNALGLEGEFAARDFCELIHAESAEVLATYGSDFYAGRPAVTRNEFGQGQAYYLASRNDGNFHDAFTAALARHLGLRPALEAPLPAGVSAQIRTDGESEFVFLMNFQGEEVRVDLGTGAYVSLLEDNAPVSGEITLAPLGIRVLRRPVAR
jgi:beta-galactosidase